MRVEVWSPDGLEAMADGSLLELRRGENEENIGLLTHDKGARVWLTPEEIEWLTDQLAKLNEVNADGSVNMFCEACGKPWRFDSASARSYVCSCGGTKAVGTVTLSG